MIIPLPLLLLLGPDSAVADVIDVVGFSWVPAVTKVSAVAGTLLLLGFLTSQDSLLWIKSLLLPLSLLLLMSFLLLVFPMFLTSFLLLGSLLCCRPYTAGVSRCSSCLLYCCQPFRLFTDSSFCYLYPAVLAVASKLLLTSLILLMFPPVLASLVLLYVPVVLLCCCRPCCLWVLSSFLSSLESLLWLV
jgi:hypothetical protein